MQPIQQAVTIRGDLQNERKTLVFSCRLKVEPDASVKEYAAGF
jgi:hypothetical protein